MRSAQTGVLGVVLLTAIVLAIISVTYVWGKPLIQKTIDKAQINLITQKLYEIDSAILYTANSGSNSVVDLGIEGGTLSIDDDNNRIIYSVMSSVPLVATSSEVPINFYELARDRQSLTFNTSSLSSADPSLLGYSSTTHHSNATLGGTFYNVSVYQNSTSGNWELLCIWRNTLVKASDCAEEGGAITKNGNDYDVRNIDSNGESAFVLGPYAENEGVYGSEPSGIISSRAIGVGDRQNVMFYLTYRPMLDKEGRHHKIILTCASHCLSTLSNDKLIIKRTNVIMEDSSIYTYVNVGVER